MSLSVLGSALLAGCGHGVPTALTLDARRMQAQGLAHLTDEERELISRGLLPANYPALAEALATQGPDAAKALARQGLTGPFADDFGDPRAMLKAARYGRDHAEYGKLITGLKRGDLVFIASNDPQDFVATLTGGPFDHVLICTDAAAPAQLVEAVGITGEPGDKLGDRVRRATLARYAGVNDSYRVMHPAAGRTAAIDKAIAFCEAQLGKPYNYTFSDKIGGDRAFYCSSLVYDAYRQAGIDWKPSKDAARDRIAVAIIQPVMALQPEDPLGLTLKVMTFLHQPSSRSPQGFADLLVREVLPGCRRTAHIALTEDQKVHLAAAIARVMQGQAFPLLQASMADFQHAAANGDLNRPITGPALRAALEARMAEDCARDAAQLVATSDINTWAALDALRALLGAAMPYADALSAYITGPHSSETKAVARFLDLLDAVRHLAPHWGRPGFSPVDLPGRAPWLADGDMESPTDLAWSSLPHEDYHVLPGWPVNPPWPYAIVPENGHFGLAARMADLPSLPTPGGVSAF